MSATKCACGSREPWVDRVCPECGGAAPPAPAAEAPEGDLAGLLDVPFTFDLLRDPEWQPTREHYSGLRTHAAAALAALRAERDEWKGYHEKRVQELLDVETRYLAVQTERDRLAKERDALANGIGEAAIARGIVNPGTAMTGPQLLLACRDLGSESGAEAREKALREALVAIIRLGRQEVAENPCVDLIYEVANKALAVGSKP